MEKTFRQRSVCRFNGAKVRLFFEYARAFCNFFCKPALFFRALKEETVSGSAPTVRAPDTEISLLCLFQQLGGALYEVCQLFAAQHAVGQQCEVDQLPYHRLTFGILRRHFHKFLARRNI